MKYIVIHAYYDQNTGMYIDTAKPFETSDKAAKFIVDDWQSTLVKRFDELPLDFNTVKQHIDSMLPNESKCWKTDNAYGINEYHWKIFSF